MKKILLVLITLAAFALVCATAYASGSKHHDKDLPDPKSYNAHFGDMDSDGDEFVDWEEFKTYFPQSTENIFEALDLDGDNAIDHDEWHRFKAAHGLKHVE